MNILITNDDGYKAIGLKTLVRLAKNRGHEITLISPYVEQSGMSHRLTITKPMQLREIELEGINGYALDGSPVDCVRVYKSITDKNIDACISGINYGRNAGTAIYYSGTDGAAREAAMLYIPSLAVSIDTDATEEMRENIANIALDLIEDLIKNPMPRLCFCNLNAPAIPVDKIKGIRLAPLCLSFYKDLYSKTTDKNGDVFINIAPESEKEPHLIGKDNSLLDEGYITISFVGEFTCLNNEMGFLKEKLETVN